jgi:hypothetical protein
MNKILNAIRNTVLGVGLAAAFFISCEKANAVFISVTGDTAVNPGNDSVFGPAPPDVPVTGKVTGGWGITMTWDENDLAGDYRATGYILLSHAGKTEESTTDDFDFTYLGEGGSQNRQCFYCLPEKSITGQFGPGDYATSFTIFASILKYQSGRQNLRNMTL